MPAEPPTALPDASIPDPGPAYRRAPARVRLTVGAVLVVIVLALGATVAVAVLRSSTAAPETLAPSAAGASVDPVALYVHVSGAVREPGLYRLEEGARVVDAIAAAAGFADDADRDAVNLARALSDGEQLVVPVEGANDPGLAPAAGGSGSTPADGLIDLNSADLAALDTLPRVGPAIAQRIIDWRETNGRFTSIEDLLAVPGIGDKMLEGLRPLVRV
jgi:competence protein ComEA